MFATSVWFLGSNFRIPVYIATLFFYGIKRFGFFGHRQPTVLQWIGRCLVVRNLCFLSTPHTFSEQGGCLGLIPHRLSDQSGHHAAPWHTALQWPVPKKKVHISLVFGPLKKTLLPRNGALAPEDVLASGNAAAAAFPSLVHHNSVKFGIVSIYLVEFTLTSSTESSHIHLFLGYPGWDTFFNFLDTSFWIFFIQNRWFPATWFPKVKIGEKNMKFQWVWGFRFTWEDIVNAS